MYCRAEHLLQEIMPELTLLRKVQQNSPWHSYNAYTHSVKATEIVDSTTNKVYYSTARTEFFT